VLIPLIINLDVGKSTSEGDGILEIRAGLSVAQIYAFYLGLAVLRY